MGPDNPLPPLRPLRDAYADLDASAADPEMAANIAYGHVRSVLPYTLQDGYSRERTATDVPVTVTSGMMVEATIGSSSTCTLTVFTLPASTLPTICN